MADAAKPSVGDRARNEREGIGTLDGLWGPRLGSFEAELLFGIAEGVFEWCRDWYRLGLPGGTDPEVSAETLATMNEAGSLSRVRRGGCYADGGWPCRSAFRLRFEPERGHEHIGMRIVAVNIE